jgi:hypothetical protein
MMRRSTVSVTGKARDLAAGYAGNATTFANPNPLPSVLLAQATVVDTAETLAATRAKGSAAARNVQRTALADLVETGVFYVQGIANLCGTPEQAVSTILAARLAVSATGKHTKPILAVTQGPVSGTVILDANAAELLGSEYDKKSYFNWSFTLDGKTYTVVTPSPKAKTSIANLTPLTSYGFRVAVTTSDGVMGPWSPVVPFIVH